jgi:hypothetical protein
MIAVTAIRFAASYNLVYDDNKASLNSGGLQEH